MLAMIGFFVLLVLALFLTFGLLAAAWWNPIGGTFGDWIFTLAAAVLVWGMVYLLSPFEIAMKGQA